LTKLYYLSFISNSLWTAAVTEGIKCA